MASLVIPVSLSLKRSDDYIIWSSKRIPSLDSQSNIILRAFQLRDTDPPYTSANICCDIVIEFRPGTSPTEITSIQQIRQTNSLIDKRMDVYAAQVGLETTYADIQFEANGCSSDKHDRECLRLE